MRVVKSNRLISSTVPFCSVVKQSSSKSDSQNFLIPVLAAVNTMRTGVTTPYTTHTQCTLREPTYSPGEHT